MLKLNCGSGVCKLPGWVNLDADAATAPDIVADLSSHIPFPDGSVDYIHSEDFVSWLPSIAHVEGFLREARRVLRPDGVMRLLVPSLERLVDAYLHRPDWLIAQWQRSVGVPLVPETAGHLLNMAFKLSPGFAFDRPTLRILLERGGFQMREVAYNESPHPALRGLDDRRPDESLSLYLECDPA